MKHFLIALLLVVCVCTFASADFIHLPQWPMFWSAQWQNCNSTTGEIDQYGPWYYDWRSEAVRQENVLGQCLDSDTTLCSFIFIGNNSWVTKGSKTAPSYCCFYMAGLGGSPPNFLYNSTLIGYGSYKWFNASSTIWYRQETVETYYQSAGDIQLPVALDGRGEAMVWSNYNFAEFPEGTWTIPQNCAKSCPQSAHLKNKIARLRTLLTIRK